MTAAARVLSTLEAQHRTLAVAESLTGGLLTDAFVQVPGASRVLRGGIVAYATALKHELIGVDASLLQREGPVHPEVARQMAKCVRTALAIDGVAADVGVSTTGVAGPDPQEGAAPGTVFVGVAFGRRSLVRQALFAGDRAQVRAQSVQLALDTLAELIGAPPAVQAE